MLKGAVKYKDVWLAPGSKALELLQNAKTPEDQKALANHIRLCNETEDKRSNRGTGCSN